MRFIIFLLCLPALLSCGGSSASKKETPKPFTFSIQHIASAVGNQPVDIRLLPSSGYTITSSSLTYDTPLVVEMTKVSETQYQLLVPEVYSDETLSFTIKATNTENTEISQSSEIALALNMRPLLHSLSQPVNAVINEPFLLEFSVEDEHEYLPVELVLDDLEDEVSIERMSDSSFTITPLAINSDSIHFEATVTDEYGQTASRSYVLPAKPAKKEETYFKIVNHGHGLLKGKKAHLSIRSYNLPENVEVNDIHWEQISGIETVTNRVDGNLYVSYPDSYSAEPLIIEASITLTDRTHYRVTESITLVEDKPYSIKLLDTAIVEKKLAKQQSDENSIDLNEDGLTDNIAIEQGIVYAEIQQTDGSYGVKEEIGKITLHQLFSDPDLREELIPDLENLQVSAFTMVDVNKDGFRDIIFTGRIVYPNLALSDSIAGWVKGVTSTRYYGDYFSGCLEASGGYSFDDFNQDGYLDVVFYDSYDTLAGPNVNTHWARHEPEVKYGGSSLPYDSIFDVADGYYDEAYHFFRLRPENPIIHNESYDPGDYVMLTVNGFSADDNYFDYGYTLTLSPNARRIYLLDINDDGKNDIIIETTEGEYQHIEVIE